MDKALGKDTRRALAIWLPVLGAALLCAAVFASGILDTHAARGNVPSWDMALERYVYSLENGDSYGIIPSEGPGYQLPAGTYRVRWTVAGDGDNYLHLSTANGSAVEPASVLLPAGQGGGEFEFTLADACDELILRFEFASGTCMDIQDLRFYFPAYRDHAFTLLFAAAAACTLWLLYSYGRLSRRDCCELLLIGAAVLFASSPALKQTLNLGHDSPWHLPRIENIVTGLRNGQFPVWLGGYIYDGYGSISAAFYPDFFLYPFALMRLCGASVTYVGNVLMAALNIAAAACMYAAARRLFEGRWTAVCASILYTLAVYRLTDVCTRYAVGEALAMSILPLFFWALWEVVRGDSRHWKALALTAAGIFLSHMITTLLCALLAAGFALLHIRRILREKRLVPILRAAGLCVLLCAFQLAPMLTYMLQGIGASGLMSHIRHNMVEPAQLLTLGRGETVQPQNPELLRFSAAIDPTLLLGTLLLVYLRIRDGRAGEEQGKALALAAGGALFAVACTNLFPWSYAETLTGCLIDYVQFTWRLLAFAVPLLALSAAYGITRFFAQHQETAVLAALCAAVLCALPTLTQQIQSDEYLRYGEGANPFITNVEYTLPDTNFYLTLDREAHVSGGVVMTQYEKLGERVTAQLEAQEDGEILLPLFGFDGYRAQVDGQTLETGIGRNNRLTVLVPAGTSGTLEVRFAGKPYWRAAQAVSLLTLLALAAGRLLKSADGAARRGRSGRWS